MKSRRVVITGAGIVSPLGCNLSEFWNNIIQGETAFSEIKSFDTSSYPHHYGAEVKNHLIPKSISKAEKKVYGKATLYAVSAATQAIADSSVEWNQPLRNRTGVILGTTFGEAQIIESATKAYCDRREIGNDLLQYCPNALSVNIAKKFRLDGPNFVIPTACAAGNYAIAYGALLIQQGFADMMIVGGSDPFSHVSFSGFSRLGVMADKVCQPFDKNRKGMIVGEGAGVLILEEYETARARSAKLYAEILSCGLTCDAVHMTIPDVSGVIGMMRSAIEDAGLSVQDIDYICAHGTGTAINDKTESKAVGELFYRAGNSVPVSSIKSMLGHTMGAASAIETIACILAIKHQVIPATANYVTRDPECDIDCVPNKPRSSTLNYVLNNALAFGGNNASLLLARCNND